MQSAPEHQLLKRQLVICLQTPVSPLQRLFLWVCSSVLENSFNPSLKWNLLESAIAGGKEGNLISGKVGQFPSLSLWIISSLQLKKSDVSCLDHVGTQFTQHQMARSHSEFHLPTQNVGKKKKQPNNSSFSNNPDIFFSFKHTAYNRENQSHQHGRSSHP